MEQAVCSETLAKLHTPENNPKENIRQEELILNTDCKSAFCCLTSHNFIAYSQPINVNRVTIDFINPIDMHINIDNFDWSIFLGLNSYNWTAALR
jgi:hypothetical protein